MELLWRRALSDKGDNLYCLVNGDLLDYDVSQKVVDCLHTLTQDYGDNECRSSFQSCVILLVEMVILSTAIYFSMVN